MWNRIDGWFDFAPLYDEQIARVLGQPATFVEVGSWLGRSSAYMAGAIRYATYARPPIKFYCVDTWRGSPNDPWMLDLVASHGGSLLAKWTENMDRCGVLDYVTPIEKPSVEAAAMFGDASLDFVFIDGEHSFNAALADIRAWLPKLKPDGVLAGHDYDQSEVELVVCHEFPESHKVMGRTWIVDRIDPAHIQRRLISEFK